MNVTISYIKLFYKLLASMLLIKLSLIQTVEKNKFLLVTSYIILYFVEDRLIKVYFIFGHCMVSLNIDSYDNNIYVNFTLKQLSVLLTQSVPTKCVSAITTKYFTNSICTHTADTGND